MKAAVLREVGKPLQIEDVQINKPGPHEVLIRTAAAGLCHSDLHFIQGSYPTALPAVLGHESAGIVEQIGCEPDLWDLHDLEGDEVPDGHPRASAQGEGRDAYHGAARPAG